MEDMFVLAFHLVPISSPVCSQVLCFSEAVLGGQKALHGHLPFLQSGEPACFDGALYDRFPVLHATTSFYGMGTSSFYWPCLRHWE